jgi:hypothetical protein
MRPLISPSPQSQLIRPPCNQETDIIIETNVTNSQEINPPFRNSYEAAPNDRQNATNSPAINPPFRNSYETDKFDLCSTVTPMINLSSIHPAHLPTSVSLPHHSLFFIIGLHLLH